MQTAVLNPAPAPATIASTVWSAIIWIAIVLIGGGMMRMAFGPLQEAVKLDMGLSDFQISLVQGIATGLPIGLFSLPVAWMTDHGNRVRLLIGLILISIIGTLWTGFAENFTSLFLARMLAAFGITCGVTVAISLSADLCPADRRGRALIVIAIGAMIGTALGFAVGGTMITVLKEHPIGFLGGLAPWREIHIVIGLVGLLLLLPVFSIREPVRHEVEIVNPALRETLRALWGKRGFLLPLFTGHLGVSMAETAAGIWAAPVLIRDFHQQPEQFAGWMGAIMLLGGLLGSALGGFGADWGHKSKHPGGILFAAVVAAGVCIPTALYPVMPSVSGLAVMLCLLMLAGTVINLVASTAIAVLIPNEERGVCMAVFGIVNSVIGLSLAPTIVTLGSSALGGESHLSTSLAITGAITAVIAFIGYIIAMKNVSTLHTKFVA